MPEQTTLVRLTPPGVGAVASLALEGPVAAEIFARRFQGNLDQPAEKPIFGRFRLDSGQFEEVIVHFAAENSLEIDIHGGNAVIKAVETALCCDGAILIDTELHILRKLSGNRAMAMRMLMRATTETTARILFDQLSGALERELAEINKIRTTAPEEAEKRTESIRESAFLGERLADGFKVAIIGPPNAGKSSLLNAILGYNRVIVDPTPGTTRDIVEAKTVINGWPFTFCDTAGIRETEHELERLGIEKTRESLANVDLILRIIDLEQPIPEMIPGIDSGLSNLVDIYNKCDLCRKKWRLTPPENAILISAVEGIGIDLLLSFVFNRLIREMPKSGSPVLLVRSLIKS